MDWHKRFEQQAKWTQAIRKFALEKAGLGQARRVLEVGCGTGVIAGSVASQAHAQVVGVDLRWDYLQFMTQHTPEIASCAADGHWLPFADGTFDLSYTHYMLLWAGDAGQVVKEMARATRPGGAVLALAEPDYGGRIDHPAPLGEIGNLQTRSLEIQGANPRLGRQLSAIFHRAGLQQVVSGVLGGQWQAPLTPTERASEWQAILADAAVLERVSAPLPDLKRLQKLDEQAWENGERTLFVPTFFAWGFVAGG